MNTKIIIDYWGMAFIKNYWGMAFIKREGLKEVVVDFIDSVFKYADRIEITELRIVEYDRL